LFRHRKEKRPTDQDEHCIAPLDSKGRGGDLVSNSEGYVPTTAAEADKAIATLNQDFNYKTDRYCRAGSVRQPTRGKMKDSPRG